MTPTWVDSETSDIPCLFFLVYWCEHDVLQSNVAVLIKGIATVSSLPDPLLQKIPWHKGIFIHPHILKVKIIYLLKLHMKMDLWQGFKLRILTCLGFRVFFFPFFSLNGGCTDMLKKYSHPPGICIKENLPCSFFKLSKYCPKRKKSF